MSPPAIDGVVSPATAASGGSPAGGIRPAANGGSASPAAGASAAGQAGTVQLTAGEAAPPGTAGAAAVGGAGAAGLVAAGGGAGAPAAPVSITFADKSKATDAWWSYERAGTYSTVSSTIKVPARDGTMLGCTLVRPAKDGVAAPGKFPGLVMEFTPYVLMATLFDTEAAFFAQRGYNALYCTIRGIGESGATWLHAFSRQDCLDAHDLVEWLGTQEFSDGRIGQFGESYGGETSYCSAVEQAPHLLAIAPMQPPASLYDDINFPGGIEAVQGGDINNWPPTAALLSLGKINADDEYKSYHDHPTYDAFWQERTLVGRHANIKVPVLTVGGWIDGYFRSGTMTNIEAALERTWVIYGQWEHLPPVDLGTCDTACAVDPLPSGVLLAWFDHWVMQLKDLPIPEKPTFVSFEGPKGASHGWRELSTWLPEGGDVLSYELGSDGSLHETASATDALTFHEPGEATAAKAALTFTTTALTTDRVLVGRATLDLRASLSAPDASFYVQLLDVDASDKETLVNDGFLKASHRMSSTTPEPAPIGEPVDYHIVIRPQHYRFAAGHRARIRLWGGDKGKLVQSEPVDVTVGTGKVSTLHLPGFAASP